MGIVFNFSNVFNFERSDNFRKLSEFKICFFSHLFVPFTSCKVLTLDNKNEKKCVSFCIVLTKSYLCTKINQISINP